MVKAQNSTEKASLAKQHKKQHLSKRAQKKKDKEIVIPNFLASGEQEEEQQPVVAAKNNKNINKQKQEESEDNAAAPLSRKEKRKQVLSQRLDRKLTALERIHEQNKMNDDAALTSVIGKPRDIHGDDDDDHDEEAEEDQEEDAAVGSASDDEESENEGDADQQEDAAPKLHKENDEEDDDQDDEEGKNKKPTKQQVKEVAAAAAAPRKAKLGGTYWKDRKEKKNRTIFVGGIPSSAGLGLIRRLINQYGADNAVKDPKHEIEVDFIRPKNFEAAKFRNDTHRAGIPKNAYCVLPTKELATRVAHALDGVWVHPEESIPITDRDANMWRQNHPGSRDKPSKLRVNAADDQSQRNIAIGKRKGGDGNKDAYYKKNKRGSKPGSLPPKKFAKKA